MCLQYKPFENTVGKGEIARNEQFLLFPQCFLPVRRIFAICIKFEIVVCKLFQFGRVHNLLFGKGLICTAVIFVNVANLLYCLPDYFVTFGSQFFQLIAPLILTVLEPNKVGFANSADQDQTSQTSLSTTLLHIMVRASFK